MQPELIKLNLICNTPQEAIIESGSLLFKAGLCTQEYIQAMVNNYLEDGTYIVIDNGIAMPHARPEYGAKGSGFSLITLKNSLKFGHDEHDPVSIIIGLVGFNANEHIQTIQKISDILERENIVQELKLITCVDDLLNIIGR